MKVEFVLPRPAAPIVLNVEPGTLPNVGEALVLPGDSRTWLVLDRLWSYKVIDDDRWPLAVCVILLTAEG